MAFSGRLLALAPLVYEASKCDRPMSLADEERIDPNCEV